VIFRRNEQGILVFPESQDEQRDLTRANSKEVFVMPQEREELRRVLFKLYGTHEGQKTFDYLLWRYKIKERDR